ncbi:MAG: Rpn family recombination-promoting nuclease/putative transposase [Janthinobacterium lividum]
MTDIIDLQKHKPQDYEARFFNPRNDVAFKKVFQHEALTLSFLNSTLRLTGDRQIQSIEFLPTEQLPMTAESKKSILDVLCTDHRGFKYIIEVQNKYMSNYIRRAQYYVAHLYANQLENAGNYLQLKPVTLLSLLNHTVFPEQVRYLSYHQNIEQETQTSYLNDMSYAFVELPKFTKTLEELITDEDHWIYMMKHAPEMREAPEDAPDAVKQAYDILEKHTWTRDERLAYERAKIGLMDDLDIMETARNEGEQIGMAKGEQRLLEEKQAIANKLIQQGMRVQEVAELIGLSVEQLKSSL